MSQTIRAAVVFTLMMAASALGILFFATVLDDPPPEKSPAEVYEDVIRESWVPIPSAMAPSDRVTLSPRNTTADPPAEQVVISCGYCDRRAQAEALEDEMDKERNRANDMARQGLNRNGTELTGRERRLLWQIAPNKHLGSLVITPHAFELMDRLIDYGHVPQMVVHYTDSVFPAETVAAVRRARQLILDDIASWKAELFREFNWQ